MTVLLHDGDDRRSNSSAMEGSSSLGVGSFESTPDSQGSRRLRYAFGGTVDDLAHTLLSWNDYVIVVRTLHTGRHQHWISPTR